MYNGGGAKFFRTVLGNIVICATVAALLLVTVTVGEAKVDAEAKQPYYSGKSAAKVSLMVNVYWGTEYIEPMLEVFGRYNAKTTFFVGGQWAVGNSDTLKKIAEAGNEIGNHGYYHKDHSKLDAAYNRKEICAAHDAVKDILDIDMTVFAPPSGAFGKTTLDALQQLGYRAVMWTRDTIDWRDHDSALITSRALKNLKGGDLILMHPTAATLEALDGILLAVYGAGLSVATVSEVLDGDVL